MLMWKNDDILRTPLFNATPRALATLDVTTFLKYIPNSGSSFPRQLLNNNDDLNTIDDNTAQRINYRTCKIYELIYSEVNGFCTMPFSFTESLMIPTLTGSKLASTTLSQTQSSGNYNTINRWYKKYGKIENEVPDGDIESSFDNNQTISKIYNIVNEKSSLLSICTTVIHTIVKPTVDLQAKTFTLNQWCNEAKIVNVCNDMIVDNNSVEISKQSIMSELLKRTPVLKKYLQKFIESLIPIVEQQLAVNNK
ncbi:unnamed protein product [Didymodactylos carnosus]|uniref:Uncharacterized protein n=1 Tax=Didymodactylos carnosus TaxID=1234261 RepID=A0A8S2CQE4_9BILA|nr:unnamed protein product [Didymodactylos carnosus]CAF3513487.1 unnamed protein product [Didymodactylos carnosus]